MHACWIMALQASTARDPFDPMQGRMRRLLAAMGNPQETWPAVHVAGTKGKGSTTAFLACMLKSAGYKVGTYTRSAPQMLPVSSLPPRPL